MGYREAGDYLVNEEAVSGQPLYRLNEQRADGLFARLDDALTKA